MNGVIKSKYLSISELNSCPNVKKKSEINFRGKTLVNAESITC